MAETSSRGGGRRRRAPRELAHAVASFRRGVAPPTLLARVQEQWAEAVGPAIAEQAFPVAESRGIVTVACRSAVWASELAMLTPELLEQLNRRLLEGAQVQGLRVTLKPT